LLPFIAEIPYALMYAFGGDTIGQISSKLSIGPIFLTILALLWQIGRRLGLSLTASSFLIAAGATSTCITYLAWDGKTDLIGLMYALIAIRHTPGLIASEKLETNAILFGLFAACAVMAKMSYALVLPFVLGTPLVLLWKGQPKKLFQICIWSLLPCLIAFTLGWWIKNAVIYQDPFAPFLQFQATTPSFPLGQAWMSPQNTHWILWTYPLAFTFGLYPMQ
ncbi:hypothetical protein ICN41_11175, partial [Polynucleobacter sp. 15G-AUS-farblos]|uniref:hypothetical protein n=1 Tax=Polynucleobacter sp. 15G-AUS-farblos TaxID=2689094 RepID=UPI001C0DF41B